MIQYQVQILKSAANTILEFAKQNMHREIIGVLFGKQEDHILQIQEAIPIRVGGRTEVDFIDDDYEKLAPIIKEQESKGLTWVGWFHSHPFKRGDHLYLSSKDITYQYYAQRQNPSWLALVINPHQEHDPNTIQGMRAFQLDLKKEDKKPPVQRPVKILNLSIV